MQIFLLGQHDLRELPSAQIPATQILFRVLGKEALC